MVQLFIANAIIEEYDEGIWHVVKYVNGRAECWGIGAMNWGTGVTWAGGYHHTQIGTTDFPAGLFVEPPNVICQATDQMLRSVVGKHVTKAGVNVIVKDGSAGGSTSLQQLVFTVIGKWK